jgi:hypothetical protein
MRMNRLLSLVTVLTIALMLPGGSASARWIRPEMSVSVQTPVPSLRANPIDNVITVTVNVQSLQFDLQSLGKAPVDGEGHIQAYLDRVPVNAFSKPAVKGLIAVATTQTFSLGFSPNWFVRESGAHTLIIALARNDGVLYPVPFAFLRVILDAGTMSHLRR